MRTIGRKNYLTCDEVAKLMGVNRTTVRRWVVRNVRSSVLKKLICFRDPINGYHYFEKRSVERLVGEIEKRRVKLG